VGDAMKTTVADIYAVGETTGIAGAGKSFIEGRVAAWDILRKRSVVDFQTYESNARPLMRRRSRQVQYGRFFGRRRG